MWINLFYIKVPHKGVNYIFVKPPYVHEFFPHHKATQYIQL